MSRKSIVITVAVIIAVAAGWFLLGGAAREETAAAPAARRPPAVTVIAATTREIAEEVNVSGTLVPREEVLVAPEIDGFAVIEINAEEGDRVARGAVLARLSRSALETQIAQADAQIAQARAQIAEAEASLVEQRQSLQRAEDLRKSGTVSAQTYEQRLAAQQAGTARVDAARQQVAVAQAQRRELDLRLSHTEIRAPTAGIISRRTLRIGQIASMAAEPAFRIIEDGDVELEASVVDVTLARLKTGQRARILAAGHREPIEGRVRLISPRVDPATRLGNVRIEITGDAVPAIGSFASAQVEIGRKTGVVLPLQAVSVTDEGAFVQRVVEGRVRSATVTLGLRAQREVEITDGVGDGESVVARAGSFLRDGDAVTPVDVPAAEPATAEAAR